MLTAFAVGSAMSSLSQPQIHVSGTRCCIKPVVIVKSGPHAQLAKAAQMHTGALAGAVSSGGAPILSRFPSAERGVHTSPRAAKNRHEIEQSLL
jgi:hypothetical protein